MRRSPDRFRLVTAGISVAAPAVLVAILVVLYQEAAPAITSFGARFLVTSSWNPVTANFGALPFIFGTVVTSAIAIALALPVGIAVAMVLIEPGAAGGRAAVGIG